MIDNASARRAVRGHEALASAFLVGLVSWFTVGRHASLEDAEGYARFPSEYLALFVLAALLGLLFAGKAKQVAWGMASAHALGAIITTSRGDGDGLWSLILVWIAGTWWVFLALAWLSGRSRRAVVRFRHGRSVS